MEGDISKELPKEQEYFIKLKRAIKDVLSNKDNPNYIDIELDSFEPLHFMFALKTLVPNDFEEIFFDS